MKSFATLCLLGIGLAVQLDKKDGGKCGPPKKCLGEIGDAELELIKGDVAQGLKDRDVPADKAEEAGQDLVDAQKAGVGCSDIEEGIRQRVKDLGGDSSDASDAVERIERAVRERTGQNELAEKRKRKQQRGNKKTTDGADKDSAEGDNAGQKDRSGKKDRSGRSGKKDRSTEDGADSGKKGGDKSQGDGEGKGTKLAQQDPPADATEEDTPASATQEESEGEKERKVREVKEKLRELAADLDSDEVDGLRKKAKMMCKKRERNDEEGDDRAPRQGEGEQLAQEAGDVDVQDVVDRVPDKIKEKIQNATPEQKERLADAICKKVQGGKKGKGKGKGKGPKRPQEE